MVSLRRRRNMLMEEKKAGKRVVMQDGALVAAAEELLLLKGNNTQKEEEAVAAAAAETPVGNPLPPARKRGRKRKNPERGLQPTQDRSPRTIGGHSAPIGEPYASTKKHFSEVAGYILDMLEVNDTYGLFSMPENLELYNYVESTNNPRDFATLRQKNSDGLYTSVEQLESDIIMIFVKAMKSNGGATLQFKEARSLCDEARKMFKSLRADPIRFEVEISGWHKKFFNIKGRRRSGHHHPTTNRGECSSSSTDPVGINPT